MKDQDFLIGQQIGNYRIERLIGRGGMAHVYKASQVHMDRYVALKILSRHLANDPQFKQRFDHEARILARLQHAYILPVHDYGYEQGYTYIVMSFVETGTLERLISPGQPLSLSKLRRIFSQLGEALDYAHTQKLVHRDIKPSNVLLDEYQNCLLTDFGIAKLVGEPTKFTQTGAILGTPLYMSPEQCSGQSLDHRSDIYSLGVMLYQMATGQVVFDASSAVALIHAHNFETVRPPRHLNPLLPVELEQVILKSLAKRPEDRFSTAGQMVQAIRRAIPDALIDSLKESVSPANEPTVVVEPPKPHKPLLPTQNFFAPDTITLEALLPLIKNRLSHDWFIDPIQTENPYLLLEKQFAINPNTTFNELMSLSPAGMTASQNSAWQQLRLLPERLLADGFLYHVPDRRPLLMAVERYLSHPVSWGKVEDIPDDLRQQWPFIMILTGKRLEAAIAWMQILAQQFDLTLLHNVAIANTFLAQEQEDSGQFSGAIHTWHTALACWGTLFAHDEHWQIWAETRRYAYRRSIMPQDWADLQEKITSYLLGRLHRGIHRVKTNQPSEVSQAYEDMISCWYQEVVGARALKRIIQSIPQTPVVPVVSPFLARQLGINDLLAEVLHFMAQMVQDHRFLARAGVGREQLERFFQDGRIYYSQLGFAAACLNGSQTQRALSILEKIKADKADFDVNNPAYRLLEQKTTLWQKDRLELLMRANWQIAAAELHLSSWNMATITQAWQKILSLGLDAGAEGVAVRMIEEQALAHLHPVTSEPDKQQQQRELANLTRDMIGLTPAIKPIFRQVWAVGKDGGRGGSLLSSLPQQVDNWQDRAGQLAAALQKNPHDELNRDYLAQLLETNLSSLLAAEQIEATRQAVNDWLAPVKDHPLLQSIVRYLQHGVRVPDYLAQTGLTYSASFQEPYTYHLNFQMNHVDVLLRLQINGDMVRIWGPLVNVLPITGEESYRYLLQVTEATPLFKAYYKSTGECGLMIETLASSLNPDMLQKLVISLARCVDMTVEDLQAYGSLRRNLTNNIPSFLLQPTGASGTGERWHQGLLAYCQRQGWEFGYKEGRFWTRPHPESDASIQLYWFLGVVRLQVQLQDRYHMQPRFWLQLLGWNHDSWLCKLVLTEAHDVLLRCELPLLDDEEILPRLLSLMSMSLQQAKPLLEPFT